MYMRHSTEVLNECIELAEKKGNDYQNDKSGIKQADYYPHGVDTIYDIMHGKMLRLKSVLAKARAGDNPNFESIEDSAKDLINYSSFMVSYLRGKMDGQLPDRDIFNNPIQKAEAEETTYVISKPSGRLVELTSNNSVTISNTVPFDSNAHQAQLDVERFGPKAGSHLDALLRVARPRRG